MTDLNAYISIEQGSSSTKTYKLDYKSLCIDLNISHVTINKNGSYKLVDGSKVLRYIFKSGKKIVHIGANCKDISRLIKAFRKRPLNHCCQCPFCGKHESVVLNGRRFSIICNSFKDKAKCKSCCKHFTIPSLNYFPYRNISFLEAIYIFIAIVILDPSNSHLIKCKSRMLHSVYEDLCNDLIVLIASYKQISKKEVMSLCYSQYLNHIADGKRSTERFILMFLSIMVKSFYHPNNDEAKAMRNDVIRQYDYTNTCFLDTTLRYILKPVLLSCLHHESIGKRQEINDETLNTVIIERRVLYLKSVIISLSLKSYKGIAGVLDVKGKLSLFIKEYQGNLIDTLKALLERQSFSVLG